MNIQELKLKSSEQLITQAEDGIRDSSPSRGLGDVYKRQSWLFGLLLIHSIGFQQLGQTWMLLKLLFVIILTLYHFYLGRLLNQFNIGNNRHSHKFYRYINEIPTILLILLIFVVIFKPI